MTVVEYRWAKGRERGISAEVVGEEIQSIIEDHGSCTPALFVDVAADPDSPLHLLIEWDQTVAAEKYRHWQARSVINSVEVIVTERKGDRTPAFVSVVENGKRGYAPYVHVATHEDLYQQAVSDIMRLLSSYRSKLAGYDKFKAIVDAIDEVLDDDDDEGGDMAPA